MNPATEPCEAAAVAERVGEAVPSYKTLHCPRRALPSSHRTPASAAGPLFSYVFGRVLLRQGSVPTGPQGGPKRAPKGPTGTPKGLRRAPKEPPRTPKDPQGIHNY